MFYETVRRRAVENTAAIDPPLVGGDELDRRAVITSAVREAT